MYILPLRETCIAYVHDATPCGCMGNAHALCIYAHALCWEVHGMARPAPKRPPPPAVRLATCLRRRPIARMHGQHPSGPDFVFSRRPRAGTCTCACAPARQGRCARAFEITAHQPSPACASTNTPLAPCMCDRTWQYRPAVHARAHRYQMHPRTVAQGGVLWSQASLEEG